MRVKRLVRAALKVTDFWIPFGEGSIHELQRMRIVVGLSWVSAISRLVSILLGIVWKENIQLFYLFMFLSHTLNPFILKYIKNSTEFVKAKVVFEMLLFSFVLMVWDMEFSGIYACRVVSNLPLFTFFIGRKYGVFTIFMSICGILYVFFNIPVRTLLMNTSMIWNSYITTGIFICHLLLSGLIGWSYDSFVDWITPEVNFLLGNHPDEDTLKTGKLFYSFNYYYNKFFSIFVPVYPCTFSKKVKCQRIGMANAILFLCSLFYLARSALIFNIHTFLFFNLCIVFLFNIILLKVLEIKTVIYWLTIIQICGMTAICMVIEGGSLYGQHYYHIANLEMLPMIGYFLGDDRSGYILSILCLISLPLIPLGTTDYYPLYQVEYGLSKADYFKITDPAFEGIYRFINVLSITIMGFFYEISYAHTYQILQKLQNNFAKK
eukprot:TRINITY_DN24229_c0_g1_i1.p1 TRINITY_DN24229_c0_g1~~TRINITY_DN24229_c0_g1_i1.p1  ORF type:complete len:435 (+),score=70.46 TRINITY_DN24229_c0_g1_i1:33-1337(+)